MVPETPAARGLVVLAYWMERFSLRPAITALTDDEYWWEPVDGAWGVRRRSDAQSPHPIGEGEFVLDYDVSIGASAPGAPVHPPTTTGWNLAHLLSIEALPTFRFLGGNRRSGDYPALIVPGTAAEIAERIERAWRGTVAAMATATEAQLSEPWDTEFGPTTGLDHLALMLHEVCHHAAQAAMLRQLHRRKT